MKELFKCVELVYGLNDRLGECLWVGIRKETNKSGIVMGGYCRPHTEEVDEVFYKQLKEVSKPQTLVLMGDLNLSGAQGQGSRNRFLEGGRDNLLTQMLDGPQGMTLS